MEENRKIPVSFEITLGEPTPYSDTISKVSARIFYKGKNRNCGLIDDDFAAQLLTTLAYAPVLGVPNGNDFSGHDYLNADEVHAYGVIPENPNVRWEQYTDTDGVTREYAATDALLWTAKFKRAKDIGGCTLSMELDPETIEGDWEEDENGEYWFKYKKGCFLGIMTLGTDYQPCFEGAAFYSKIQNEIAAPELAQVVAALRKYSLEQKVKDLSDDDFRSAIVTTGNFAYVGHNDTYATVIGTSATKTTYSEYSDYQYIPFTVGDTKTIQFNYDNIAAPSYFTPTELAALQALRSSNNGTLVGIDELINSTKKQIEELTKNNQTVNNEKVELQNEKNALISQRDEYSLQIEKLTSQNQELLAQIESNKTEFQAATDKNVELNAQLDVLKQQQIAEEKTKKENILNIFKKKLSSEEIAPFERDIDSYSADELKQKLSTLYFDLETPIGGLIPHIHSDVTEDIYSVLDDYKKNGGNK